MADGELAGVDVIRRLTDHAATLLLRFAILSLSPGLLVTGRSLRAKAYGLRALLMLGVAVTILAVHAALLANVLPITQLFPALLTTVAPSFALIVAINVALESTAPLSTQDFPVGWSAFSYGPPTAQYVGATVSVENDFLGLAVGLLTRVHPLVTRAQAQTIRDTLADDFEAMAGRPELERLPSMLPWHYPNPKLGLQACAPSRGHAYVYCPPHAVGAKLPLVVVCHGHGGNPLVGCLPWEDLADDLGFVAAFPTFGYGNWEHPDAAAAILRCRQAVTERFAVDGSRAVLAGLSQGGCGVTRGATAATWAGLVYVSPTMEPRRFDADFATWSPGPILVAQGGRDINVKPRTVDAGVAALRSLGLDVTYVQDPDADHFYFFEKRADFAERFRAWWPS